MSDREFTISHHGNEVFMGKEDEFCEQCEYAVDNPLGPLMINDKEFNMVIANPFKVVME